jgi:uncharacterized protein (DUF924 family)
LHLAARIACKQRAARHNRRTWHESCSKIAIMDNDRHSARADAWIGEVNVFWFEELRPEQWFRIDAAVDETIGRRFGELRATLAAEPVAAPTPQAALARVIVLDQFSRNMFRGSPAAFSSDALALQTAQTAIAAGLDRQLTSNERQFLYMPFQHSEDRAVQRRSIELFESLDDPDVLSFAVQHKEIVDRFGRFPHRNAALGRRSTAAELEFLKTGPTFG